MLVLSRKAHEAILVDGPAKIVVLRVRGQVVRIGVEAANGIRIWREEIAPKELPPPPTVAQPIIEQAVEQEFLDGAACLVAGVDSAVGNPNNVENTAP